MRLSVLVGPMDATGFSWIAWTAEGQLPGSASAHGDRHGGKMELSTRVIYG